MEEILINTIKHGDIEELQDVLEIPGLGVSFNKNEAFSLALAGKKFDMASLIIEHATFEPKSVSVYDAVQLYRNNQWYMFEALVTLGWDVNANGGYLLRLVVADQNIEWLINLLKLHSINVTVGNFAIVNIARYSGNKELTEIIWGCQKIRAFKEPKIILETAL